MQDDLGGDTYPQGFPAGSGRTLDQPLGADELLRLIADAAPMMISYVDRRQRYGFVNRRYTEYFGLPGEQIVGLHVRELLGEPMYESLRAQIDAALAGRCVAHEIPVRRDGGEVRWFSAVLAPHVVRPDEVRGFVVLAHDVTDRRRAEEALRQQNDLLRAITDGTTDAIFVKDLEGRYLMANHVVAEIVGLGVDQVVGKRDVDLFPEDTAQRIRADDTRVVTTGRLETIEQTLSIRGEPRVFSATKGPYRDHRGQIIGLVGISRDITEHKRTEQALRDSDARARESLAELEHIYATAPVGLCLHGTDLRMLRINERLAAIDGIPAVNHVGRTLSEILPEVARVVEPVLRAVIESGAPALDVELTAATPARPAIDAVVSFYPLKSDQGGIQGVSVVVQDITERKRAEEALRDSEERLSRILESAMDAIVTIDAHRTIKLFNAAAEKVFRWTAAEALGASFDRFSPPVFRELLTRGIQAVDRGEGGRRYMWAPEGLTALRADGQEFPVEATISEAQAAGQTLYTIILRDVHERQRAEAELRKLAVENVYLREEAGIDAPSGEIVGTSAGIRKVLQCIEQVAATEATVLVTGETGTGKELVARAIHDRSGRKDGLLVKVNCAALPGGLIESELFGHEKGAFTGALNRRLGRFELANGGTIFLDEIGDLPLELQAKLLRVLQGGEFERVGGTQALKTDVRVVAATHRDLDKAVAESRFRADLFYRLNVFPIRVPPLRERREDIPRLVRHFALQHSAAMGRRITSVPKGTMDALCAYHWPGNIRELQNVIERAIILSQAGVLELSEWPPAATVTDQGPQAMTMAELERRHILKVLEITNWRVSGQNGAARILGMKPTTLESRMKKLGVARPS